MKNIQLLSSLLFLLSYSIHAQNPVEGGYIQLTAEEYNTIVEINKENELDGKYYVRQVKDNKIMAIRKIEYLKGKKHGEWLHFLTFKKKEILDLSIVENYEDDYKNGYYYSSDNGFTSTEEGYYKKDKKEGIWYVTKMGSKEKIFYKDGKKHGDYWRQDESGVIIKGAYKKDKKHGDWTIQDLSGVTTILQENEEATSSADTSNVTPSTDDSSISSLQGRVLKPTNAAAPIAVVRLQLTEFSCAYAFTDVEGKFSIEYDTTKITPDSYFEIVIEGFPRKTISFSEFSSNSTMILDKRGKKVAYEEYRSFYQSMKDCNL